jgi:hypothetical protein
MLLIFADEPALWAFRAALRLERNKAADPRDQWAAGKHGTRRWALGDGTVLCRIPAELEAAARATGLALEEIDATKADLSAPPTLARYVVDTKAEYDDLSAERRFLLRLRIERGEARRAGKVAR